MHFFQGIQVKPGVESLLGVLLTASTWPPPAQACPSTPSVVPAATVQEELGAVGQDISLYIKDSAPEPRTWRWLFRITVQVGDGRGSSGGRVCER